MILSLEVSNFRSFMSPSTIYLAKRSLRTNHPSDGNWVKATNRVSAIFGANASGKSNFVRVLPSLAAAIRSSDSNPEVLKSLRLPHKLAPSDLPTQFELDFVVEKVRYRWLVSLLDEGVEQETLIANESRQWKLIFDRHRDHLRFGPSAGLPSSARSAINERSTNWTLVASAWMNVKNRGPFAASISWLRDSVRHVAPDGTGVRNTSSWTADMLRKPEWLNLASRFMEVADVGISGIELRDRDFPEEKREEVREIIEFIISRGKDSEENSESIQFPDVMTEIRFRHSGAGPGQHFMLTAEDESLGTNAWLETVVPAAYMLVNGGVLVIDELDSSLHPMLVRFFVGLFEDARINTSGCQLLFTTHDVTLLGNYPGPAMDMESTWLAEKYDGISTLVSFDEFKLAPTHNPEKRYMNGAFGAIPTPYYFPLYEAVDSIRDGVDPAAGEEARP